MGISARTAQGAANGGFTMIELTIAMVIVTIASVGGFASHHASRELIRQSEEESMAVSDLENAFNRILVEDVDDLVDPVGPYPNGQDIALFNSLNLGDERIRVSYPNLPAMGIPDVLEIRLTLTWTSFNGQQRILSGSTCKAK